MHCCKVIKVGKSEADPKINGRVVWKGGDLNADHDQWWSLKISAKGQIMWDSPNEMGSFL